MKNKNIFKFDLSLLIIFIVIPNLPYKFLTSEVINISTFLLISVIGLYHFIKNGVYINKIEISGIIFISIFIVISCIQSTDIWLSLTNSLAIPSLIISYLYFKTSRNKDELLTKYILVGGGINSLISILGYLVTYDSSYTRLEGIMNYGNTTALYLAICSITFLYNYSNILSYSNKNIYKIISLLTITGLLITQSRGGVIVYLIGLILSGHKNLRIKLLYNTVAIILAALIIKNSVLVCILFIPIALYMLLLEKDKTFKENKYIKVFFMFIIIIGVVHFNIGRLGELNLSNGEFQERLVFMGDAYRVVKENLLGIGAGNFNKQQFIYQSASYDIKYVHNGFIQYAIDYGIGFLLIFLIILISSYYNSIRKKGITSIWNIIFIMIVIHSLVDFSLSFITITLFLVLCIFKMNDNLNTYKNFDYSITKYITTVVIVCSFILGALLLPYQIMYNKIINNSISNIDESYSKIKNMNNYICKDNRYYFKMGILALSNNDLIEAENALTKYLDLEKNDVRANEALAQVYLNMNKIEAAEKILNNLIYMDKYYTKGYCMLFQIYYKNLQDILVSNDLNKTRKEINKIKLLISTLEKSQDTINEKAKYMKNQPIEYINNNYNALLEEVKYLDKLIN